VRNKNSKIFTDILLYLDDRYQLSEWNSELKMITALTFLYIFIFDGWVRNITQLLYVKNGEIILSILFNYPFISFLWRLTLNCNKKDWQLTCTMNFKSHIMLKLYFFLPIIGLKKKFWSYWTTLYLKYSTNIFKIVGNIIADKDVWNINLTQDNLFCIKSCYFGFNQDYVITTRLDSKFQFINIPRGSICI
jgi:hypothetical protein